MFCFLFFFSSSVCLLVTLIATFRETQDLLAVECFEDVIDEDEFILLYDLNSFKNLDFPYDDYGRFVFKDMNDSECLPEFRVKKRDIPALAAALQIPDDKYKERLRLYKRWPCSTYILNRVN